MRLHRLEICGFGPYPHSETVDFDELGSDGLFLLHGDTGAGKTTLLDAVAFALFGAVPGARGEAKRLRCDTAPAGTPTEVGLELTVAGQRLRLLRSPEYQRPKARGEGTTKQPAKASLVWVDDADREPLTRLDEVGATVSRLLGLNAEQFFQVVLLPQGEFARFLRAETAEREKLLTKLFATERFSDVERWFSEHRIEQGRRRDRYRQRVQRLAARLAQAAGENPPDEDAAVESTWIDDIRARCHSDAARADAEHAETAAAAERAEARLTEARAQAERVRRLRAARTELAELDGQTQERRDRERDLEQARRAVPVMAARRAREKSGERRATAERSDEDTRRALSARGVAVTDLPAIRAEVARYRERAGELSAMVALAEEQRTGQRRLTELDEELAGLDERLSGMRAEQAELPQRTASARAELDAARQAAARAESLAATVRECAEPHAAAVAVPGARAVVATAGERQRAAVTEHQRARERVLDLRTRRLDGMAAELAGSLVTGDACPVCGSMEHPAPAEGTDQAVSEQEEREAEAAERATATAREQATEAAGAAERELAGLLERAGDATVEELAARLEAARIEQRRNEEHRERLPELQGILQRAERAETEMRENLERTAKQQAASRAERDGLAEQVAARADRLEQARGSHDTVALRREHLLATASAGDEAVAARTAFEEASARHDEQCAALDEAVAAAGFPDEQAAVAAGRTEQGLAELREWISEHDRRRAAAEAVTAEPDLAGIDPSVEVDVTLAERESASARERADAALVRARTAQRRAGEVATLSTEVAAGLAELAPIEAQYAELDALTDVINGRGQNSKRISLRSYVLAARLEEVATSASRRLRTMSGGRYSFEYSDSKGARGTRGGLGIEVRDDYSGCLRSAKTLSGGESFLASLALALGLSDVVTAETGAAALDTLFIDEGFGSLDADTLEAVMDALDELREGGRVVGLVSHVEEMRQRIPMRLLVRKSRGGSTVDVDAG